MANISKITLPDGSSYDIKDDVSGYIPSPSGASSGEFLKYNGTSWVADSVPGGASPSDATPSASTSSGSAGTATTYSRGDHAHPVDTSRAPLASPAFTGNPTAPTQTAGNNSTRIATTAFVQTAISGITDNDTKTSFYGTSSTAAATQAKTTTSITDYALRTGNIVAIKFSNANTYTSNKITLNVSSTGAKDVWYQGAVTSSTNTLTWKAGQTLTFVYTGSVYICISKDDIVPKVTFVKYGTATFAEVEAVQGNGKLVIAYNQSEVQRFAPYIYYDVGGLKHKFYYIDEDGEIHIWTLDSSNAWSTSSSKWYVPRTRTINSKALSSDITLTASDISGTVDVANGGTGKTSFTANQAIISGSTTTGAFTSRAITNNTATSTAITGSTNLVTMNTLRYAINRTTSVAAADTNYTTYMARGESLVTTDTTPTNNGEIAWVYG